MTYTGDLPVPTDLNSQANGPLAFGNLAGALWPKLNNSFANAGLRDSTYQAWVAAGNAMRDGLFCSVAGMPQMYQGGVWHGLGPSKMVFGTGPTTFNYTNPQGAPYPGLVIGRVDIPDFGVPYRIQADCAAEVYSTDVNGTPVDASVTRVDSIVSCAGTDWDLFRGDVGNHHKHYGVSPVTFTGAQTFNMQAFRAVPEPGVGYWKTSLFNYWMRALVIPA